MEYVKEFLSMIIFIAGGLAAFVVLAAFLDVL